MTYSEISKRREQIKQELKITDDSELGNELLRESAELKRQEMRIFGKIRTNFTQCC